MTLAVFDPDTATPAFTISSPPSSQDNLKLSLDLLAQDRHQRPKDGSCIAEIPSGSGFRGGLHGRGDVCDTNLRVQEKQTNHKPQDTEHCDVDDFNSVISEMRSALVKLEAFEFLPMFRQYGYGPGDTTAIFHISLPEVSFHTQKWEVRCSLNLPVSGDCPRRRYN